MKDYGRVQGSVIPPRYEITERSVFITSDVVPYTEVIDGETVTNYSYNLIQYTKNEYIQLQAEQIESLTSDLLDAETALCDLYETLIAGE